MKAIEFFGAFCLIFVGINKGRYFLIRLTGKVELQSLTRIAGWVVPLMLHRSPSDVNKAIAASLNASREIAEREINYPRP